jgi:uncharacterized membrane protein
MSVVKFILLIIFFTLVIMSRLKAGQNKIWTIIFLICMFIVIIFDKIC